MFQQKQVLATIVAGALAIGATAAHADAVTYDFSTVQGQYTGQAGGLVVNGATFSSPSDASVAALGDSAFPGAYQVGPNNLYSTLGGYMLSTLGSNAFGLGTTLNVAFSHAQNGLSLNFAIGDFLGLNGQDQLTVSMYNGTTLEGTQSFGATVPGSDLNPQGTLTLTGVPAFTSLTLVASDGAGNEDLAIADMTTTTAVPLPASLPLLLSGALGVATLARRRKALEA